MATYKDVTLQSKDGSTNYYPHTEASLVKDSETGKTVKEQIDTLGINLTDLEDRLYAVISGSVQPIANGTVNVVENIKLKKHHKYTITYSTNVSTNASKTIGIKYSPDVAAKTIIVPSGQQSASFEYIADADYDNASLSCYWGAQGVGASTLVTMSIKDVEIKDVRTIIVASSNSSIEDKMSADFLCDGTNDVRTINDAIKVAINRKVATVYLKKGIYYINEFDELGKGINITLPETVSSAFEIILKGDGSTMLNDGTTLSVTPDCYNSLDANTQYSVVSVTSQRIQSMVSISNICVCTHDNQKKIVAINAKNFGGQFDVINCRLIAFERSQTSILDHVAVEGSIGLLGSCIGSNSGSGQKYERVFSVGFYECIAFTSEHILATKCLGAMGVYGYTFGCHGVINGTQTNHPIVLLECNDELNVNYPKFGNTYTHNTCVYLYAYSFERKPGNTPGGKVEKYASEDEPNTWKGYITYDNCGSKSAKFWEDGHGHGFRTINTAHPQACSTSDRNSITPNYMQHIFDTDLNKELICIDEVNKVWVDMNGNHY